ncbi:uncharacterized [Tachysurus ichikawai]
MDPQARWDTRSPLPSALVCTAACLRVPGELWTRETQTDAALPSTRIFSNETRPSQRRSTNADIHSTNQASQHSQTKL